MRLLIQRLAWRVLYGKKAHIVCGCPTCSESLGPEWMISRPYRKSWTPDFTELNVWRPE